MRTFMAIVISMQVIKVSSRRYVSSSDESIENLLYYKDCQHKNKGTSEVTLLRNEIKPTPAPRQPECPYPKMCCSMSCGNDCGSEQSYMSRQMNPLQSFDNIQPLQQPPSQPHLPVQPQLMQRVRKKKPKPPPHPPMPLGGRRDFGFTKERIKSLISQDDDIRKVLKDLVRVTMKKVDLLQMVNNRRSMKVKSEETSDNSEEEDD